MDTSTILGMSVADFTLLHVIISLVAIATGFVVVGCMLAAKNMPGITSSFLLTTILTSVTGFFFHSKMIGPPHVFGVISLVALAVAVAALYVYRLQGRWRVAYIVTAILSLYLNSVVAIVQSFQKIPPLQALAPTQSEPPFLAAQAVLLLIIASAGFMALRKFRPVMA